MPSYLHPGVYVEEIPSGSRPIEGVATSITAFVGVTQRNSRLKPTLIDNMDDYLEIFGPILSSSNKKKGHPFLSNKKKGHPFLSQRSIF